MSDMALIPLLSAMGIAAYQRKSNETFEPLTPPPEWFQRLGHDRTFPFLGHILEEAIMFWQRGTPGASEFGPCAEVNEAGVEFHYKVTAVLIEDVQYLVFQLDEGADQMREVLQKVRNQALSGERDKASHQAVAASLRETNQAIKAILQQLVVADVTPEQRELLNTLAAKCVDQMGGIQKLIMATIPHV